MQKVWKKICSNITMVEVQTRTPLEKIQCDNIWTLMLVMSLDLGLLHMKICNVFVFWKPIVMPPI